ncbi:class F sortase [Streptomyces sp. NPDC086766]|uniref:class F sortase n=1 Tax=Streptomyces sp. NPDC086766 TaxID=3365754 RepID=UPI0038046C53
MASPQSPRTEQPGTEPAARPRRNHLVWPAAAVALGALLIHNSLDTPVQGLGSPTHVRPTTVYSSVPDVPDVEATPPPPTDDGSLSRSEPTRLSIPSIGVNAPFTKLNIGPSGQLQAPPPNNTNLVGWFEGGVSPGERGASIVVGHLDTKIGRAVFADLDTLQHGSLVKITRADGVTARFKVDSVQVFSKANFPNDKVYADTPTPELRLITCGGAYNRTVRDYEDNVVVFAHLDSTDPA